METFIKNYIPLGNIIITDGFSSYNLLNQFESSYNHIKHLRWGGDFGLGLQSTSYIESLWSQIKGIIKSSYYSIPLKIFNVFYLWSRIKN